MSVKSGMPGARMGTSEYCQVLLRPSVRSFVCSFPEGSSQLRPLHMFKHDAASNTPCSHLGVIPFHSCWLLLLSFAHFISSCFPRFGCFNLHVPWHPTLFLTLFDLFSPLNYIASRLFHHNSESCPMSTFMAAVWASLWALRHLDGWGHIRVGEKCRRFAFYWCFLPTNVDWTQKAVQEAKADVRSICWKGNCCAWCQLVA